MQKWTVLAFSYFSYLTAELLFTWTALGNRSCVIQGMVMSLKGLVLEGFKHWIFLISVKELLKPKLKTFCGSLKSLPTQLF